jgi:hypothetical protein
VDDRLVDRALALELAAHARLRPRPLAGGRAARLGRGRGGDGPARLSRRPRGLRGGDGRRARRVRRPPLGGALVRARPARAEPRPVPRRRAYRAARRHGSGRFA